MLFLFLLSISIFKIYSFYKNGFIGTTTQIRKEKPMESLVRLSAEPTIFLIIAILVVIVLKLILQKRSEKVRKAKFQDDISRAYSNANRAYEELNRNGDIPFTQAEIVMLDLALKDYSIYQGQIFSGTVDINIAEKLDATAAKLRQVNQQRLKRGQQTSNTQRGEHVSGKESRKSNKEHPMNFFQGCTSIEQAKLRHKNLCKAFHPDTGNGDDEMFREMEQEYEIIMEFLSGAGRTHQPNSP